VDFLETGYPYSMRLFLYLAPLLLVATCVALAQTPSARPCDKFVNNKSIYYGLDDQIISDAYFNSTPTYPIPSTLPYLKRLAVGLRAQGILPVFALLPQPGIAYLGKLDPTLIKGTLFERLSSPSTLPGLVAGYQETQRAFKEAGFETPDLATGLADFMKSNPSAMAYFKHDGHWAPDGSKAAAYAVSKHLNENYPALAKEINTKKLTVSVKEVVPHTSIYGWDGYIAEICPGYQPYVESLPILELKQSEAVSEATLFGNEQIDVTEVGTSFSAGPHGPGFVPFLSEALGTNVLNAAINGGGALGGMNEWALNLKSDALPKVLIWELPPEQINSPKGSNPLTTLMLRQIMPLLQPKLRTIQSLTVPLKTGLTKMDLPISRTPVNSIRINFDSFLTRKFHATLVFENGTEEFDFIRSHGNTLGKFNLELVEPVSVKKVIIETFEPVNGTVTLETMRYR
jgi:SGNH hydrolase-like domain, acetyltransferase AlgX